MLKFKLYEYLSNEKYEKRWLDEAPSTRILINLLMFLPNYYFLLFSFFIYIKAYYKCVKKHSSFLTSNQDSDEKIIPKPQKRRGKKWNFRPRIFDKNCFKAHARKQWAKCGNTYSLALRILAVWDSWITIQSKAETKCWACLGRWEMDKTRWRRVGGGTALWMGRLIVARTFWMWYYSWKRSERYSIARSYTDLKSLKEEQ